MVEEHGIVMAIKTDRAILKTERGSTCERCQAKEFCYSLGEKETFVEVDNPVNANIGDMVIFKIPTSAIIKTSLIIYLVPLFAFIAGVVIGQKFAGHLNPDLASGIFGVIFLTAAFFGIRIYGKAMENKKGVRPTIVRLASK
ncbi:MAG: SoxR reducing system RseC family protein [Deltaproteobacteria bacterium]|nr:SoxR reducing system RseC family protein [Deltaproteobacteria bacterium]